MEKVYMNGDVIGIASIFLQMKYEKLTENEKDRNKMQIEIFPLFKDMCRPDYKFVENTLNQYVETLNIQADEYTFQPKDFKKFCDFYVDKIKETKKYKKEVMKNRLKYTDSYVYNKKTGEFIEVELGEHFATIKKMLIKNFGKDKVNDVNCHDEMDKYINENLIIKSLNNKSK